MTRHPRTFLLIAAVLGVLAWFVVRGRSAREVERADTPRVEVPADTRAELSAESQPLDPRISRRIQAANAGAKCGLRFRVVDERTLKPVPDLGFLVYLEQGVVVELGRGRTDVQGRAELHDLEPTRVLVRIERKPPYAEQTRAAWLVPGEAMELDIRVGPGGAIVGRVVDDLDQPVAGATIQVDGCEDVSSGPDGHFRVEHLAPRPSYARMEPGSLEPSWELVQITATNDIVSSSLPAMPVAGKDVDVGDLELPRLTTYTGRLLDAGGRPVAGAALAPRPGLAGGPAAPDFQLRPGDVLTDGAGRFELRVGPVRPYARVRTRDGAQQALPLPQGQPGGRVDDVELWLKPETMFEFEFVDASGAPSRVPGPIDISDGVGVPWTHEGFGRGDVCVRARTSGGDLVWSACEAREVYGKWCARLQIDPHSIREFEVSVDGYASVIERPADVLPALVQRKLTLEPFPVIRVRLVRKQSDTPLDPRLPRVQLQVCMADPARHALAGGRCCGLGAYWNEIWGGGPTQLSFPVYRQAPFWIYARAAIPAGGMGDVASFGPFQPGPEVHEFALDPAAFLPPKYTPQPGAPGEIRRARLRARVIDARTGQPLKDAWIAAGRCTNGVDGNGEADDAPIEAGSSPVRVSARGYRTVELGERARGEGERLELGTIGLEPLPQHRLRLVDADGVPLPDVAFCFMEAHQSPALLDIQQQAQPDGSFLLLGDMPARFVLHARVGAETQRLLLEPWPTGVLKEIRLARCRRIVVTVAGTDFHETRLAPSVCPAKGESAATCDHAAEHVPRHDGLAQGQEIASSQEGRRFVFLLAPGRYVFWGSNLMHELPLTELEVAPGDTDLELTIRAH